MHGELVKLGIDIGQTSVAKYMARLDHIVVTGEQHLRHVLKCHMVYYNPVRTHLSLGKDAPNGRAIQRHGRIKVRSILGGLRHQYVRI